jgi:hypothetical protein
LTVVFGIKQDGIGEAHPHPGIGNVIIAPVFGQGGDCHFRTGDPDFPIPPGCTPRREKDNQDKVKPPWKPAIYLQ